MAEIFPQQISQQQRLENPGRRAEYKVYDSLAKLGDRWLVLYGSALKWIHRYGVSDRETEFIVAHPDLGIVSIEVKGGSIIRKGCVWYTTPLKELDKPLEKRVQNEIKNPYTQVTDAAKAYKRQLEDYTINQMLPKWKFEIGTAVCFPDIEIKSSEFLGADAPRELTLDCNDLTNISDRIYDILKLYQKKSGFAPPGEDGIKILKHVLACDFVLNAKLGTMIEEAEKQRKELTEEQFKLLYSLNDNPRMLIPGCAGSGKTIIAAEKARRLVEQGFSVLLTCYNVNLAAWLSGSTFAQNKRIVVSGFHNLCRQVVETCPEVRALLPRVAPTEISEKEKYFKKTLPEAMSLAALEKKMQFDAIIVDEGQDFESAWLESLVELLKDRENGIMYLFFDDNQKLYRRENIPFNKKWPVFRLTRNMRNTDQIFREVKRFYFQPHEISPSGIKGPEPWYIDIQHYSDEYEALQHVLIQLVDQGLSTRDIAILTPRAKENSAFGTKHNPPGRFAPTWKLGTIGNQVSCLTIHSFKGLERLAIILVELDHAYPDITDELFYVATSRARTHLVLLGQYPINNDPTIY